jgi:hypothetical protein
MGNGTPPSSRRSVTSDYETSSILDSASMYGGDETSASSPAIQTPIQQREVQVTDDSASKNTSNKKKTKEPAPIIVTTRLYSSPTDNNNRSPSVTGDDIEVAFDSINDYRTSRNKSKEPETTITPDSLFGLSTIKENLDTDETIVSPKRQNDDEIDNYFNKIKQTDEGKKPKKTAPVISQSKSKEQKRSTPSQSDDIQSPTTSISIKADTTTPNSPTTIPTKNQTDDKHDSTDEDVDEIIGKLEVSLSGKYTHTHIHTHIISPRFIFIIKTFYSSHILLISVCMCVQCIFLLETFRTKKNS